MRAPIPTTLTEELLVQRTSPTPAERLERGEILIFRPGMLELPPEPDQVFLREELGARITLKNISYHPEGDYLSGMKRDADCRQRTRAILRAHNEIVVAFLERVFPEYADDWRSGKVNFRPLQERGRALRRHSSNELVHVDAFASGATHGDRVLRFFTNIHPTEPRVWKSAGLFPDLFREFGPAAGIASLGRQGLAPDAFDRAYTGLVRTLARLGLEQALMADTSPYDRAMKKLHDHLKDDDAFQKDDARFTTMSFAPFTSWCVLTDMVSHAAVSGRHALVNTFYVKLERCAVPDLAPFHVMARG